MIEYKVINDTTKDQIRQIRRNGIDRLKGKNLRDIKKDNARKKYILKSLQTLWNEINNM